MGQLMSHATIFSLAIVQLLESSTYH